MALMIKKVANHEIMRMHYPWYSRNFLLQDMLSSRLDMEVLKLITKDDHFKQCDFTSILSELPVDQICFIFLDLHFRLVTR